MKKKKGINKKSVNLDIETLSGHLWETANILRGTVDPTGSCLNELLTRVQGLP
jgi:hypothetical protein